MNRREWVRASIFGTGMIFVPKLVDRFIYRPKGLLYELKRGDETKHFLRLTPQDAMYVTPPFGGGLRLVETERAREFPGQAILWSRNDYGATLTNLGFATLRL